MIVILPIEIYAREVAYKVQLATYLANKGFQVVMAQQSKARFLASKIGNESIFLGKHFFHAYDHKYSDDIAELIKAHVNLIFLDEEGAEFIKDDELFNYRMLMRLPFSLVPKSTKFLHWGDRQASLANRHGPEFEHHVVGAPSLDAFAILRKYKEMLGNNISSSKILLVINQEGLTPAGRKNFGYFPSMVKKLTHDRLNAPTLTSLDEITEEIRIEAAMIVIASFMERQQIKFKLRPHPGQNSSAYLQEFKRDLISDSRVIDIFEELSSSHFLVHPGCTTALQAHYAGIKTIQIAVDSEKSIDDIYVDDVRLQRIGDFQRLLEKNFDFSPNSMSGLTELGKSIFANEPTNPGMTYKKIAEQVEATCKKNSSNKARFGVGQLKKLLNINLVEVMLHKFRTSISNIRPSYFKQFNFNNQTIDYNMDVVSKVLDLKKPIVTHLYPDVILFNPIKK